MCIRDRSTGFRKRREIAQPNPCKLRVTQNIMVGTIRVGLVPRLLTGAPFAPIIFEKLIVAGSPICHPGLQVERAILTRDVDLGMGMVAKKTVLRLNSREKQHKCDISSIVLNVYLLSTHTQNHLLALLARAQSRMHVEKNSHP